MGKVEVTMPKMGESITEGTIVTWHKKAGDKVELDESLLEIGTDKVDTDVPSPGAGTVAEIRVDEGETVDVGTVIAIIDTDGASNGAAPETTDTDQANQQENEGTEKQSPQEATPSAQTPSSGGETMQVLMPKMGESVMEGTVLTWMKAPGDSVELDEALLEIATDKVDTEVPSPASGVLKEILVHEGETVDVETPIAVIAIGGAADDSRSGSETSLESGPSPRKAAMSAAPTSAATAAGAEEPAAGQDPSTASADKPVFPSASGSETSATSELSRISDEGRFLSPLVRSIAEKEGIRGQELASITGTGRDGRIRKQDILEYLERRGQAAPTSTGAPKSKVLSPSSPVPQNAAGERVEIVKMDRIRQLIAEHMTRSKATSAHVTSFAEADVTNLVRLRERNKEAFFNREGVKLTYTPFFVYAAVEALREHPILNASVVDETIHYKKDYHIGIAVAIGTTGLVVPVIRDAGQKNLVGLAHAAADLAERSRTKQLGPDDLQGGTFTVTNVGSLGSIMGTPIINQPQLGILATGAFKKRPIVIEDPVMGDTIGIRSIMYVSLSYDHRVVDGAMGASFLARFVDVLESFDANEIIK